MTGIRIVRVERLDLCVAQRAWPFAEQNRNEIERYFEELRQAKPAVFNGRILLLQEHSLAGPVFRGCYFETEYANFVAWRDWDFPDTAVMNCFSLGALRTSDGAFLLGVMGAHTLNAGTIYFPAGTPEPGDIVGQTVDLAGNIWREVQEETGLGRDAYEAEDGWYCVFAGHRIAQVKILHARDTAAVLRGRIMDYLAREQEPELADIRIVRSPADLDPMMPPFVTAFLRHIWSRES